MLNTKACSSDHVIFHLTSSSKSSENKRASPPHTRSAGGSESNLSVTVLVHETEKPNAPVLLAMRLDTQLPKAQANLLAGACGCLHIIT